MVVLAVDMRDICCYRMLVENKTMNIVRYLGFLKRFIGHWPDSRKYAV